MKKTVLVIGGSMFTGRVFSLLASKTGNLDIHVANRGQFPLHLDNVSEYQCDRHRAKMLARILPDIQFDTLIDFCAYTPGEVSAIAQVLGDRIKQYVYVSTASVYKPKNHEIISESGPVVSGPGDSTYKKYINDKLMLERETIEACAQSGIKSTILRPPFIYGPFNYIAREPYYIEMIARGHVVPVVTDSTSRFSFVYVVDVAHALESVIGNEKAYNQVFNLSGPEAVTYPMLMSLFERFNGGGFPSRYVTVSQVRDEHIPLPFPLTEDELYSGEKFAKTFDFSYTPFEEGMEKTFKVFYSLYTS